MSKTERTTLVTLAGLATTFIVYVSVRVLSSDETFSIIPGWHTTAYPPDISWTLLTAIILVTSLLVYLTFRVTIKILTALWTRLKSR